MTNIHKRYAEASLSMLCSRLSVKNRFSLFLLWEKWVAILYTEDVDSPMPIYYSSSFVHACFFHGTDDKNTVFPSVVNSTVSMERALFFIIQNHILFLTWTPSSSLHTLESLIETSWAPPSQCVWFPHAYCCKYKNSQKRKLFNWKALRLTSLSTCT